MPDTASHADPRTRTASPIDHDLYPVHERENGAYAALVRDVRAALDDDGCAVLRGFVRPDALEKMTAEAAARSHHAHFDRRYTNPYSGDDDPSLPESHPQRVFQERTNGFVAGDCLEPETTLRALYHDDGLRNMVADCMGVDELHEYEDPLAGLVVNVLRPGCQHPWHFDNNDFIVSMLTQPAESGGTFEYCPNIRSARDENFAGVQRVLEGDRGPVKELDLRPGDLQIFYGRNSLHRVTRVEGERERHTLILAYAEQPGLIAGIERTKRLFGRVHEAHRIAAAGGNARDAL